jgi:hypothetical protein
LYRVFGQLLKGVIAAGAPILSRIAAAVIGSADPRRGFHVAKRYYCWLENDRFDHRHLLKPAYGQTRRLFSSVKDKYILVALSGYHDLVSRFFQPKSRELMNRLIFSLSHVALVEICSRRHHLALEEGVMITRNLDFSDLEKPYGYRFEGLCFLKATGCAQALASVRAWFRATTSCLPWP